MMDKPHSRIGQEIEAYCGRCRLDRTHRIVAQDEDGSIRKIICGMCNTYRLYRPKQTSTRTTKRTTPDSTISKYIEPTQASRNYSMKESYEVGEVIAHSKFGVGRVITLKDYFKIEVKFPEGVKVLLQNQ